MTRKAYSERYDRQIRIPFIGLEGQEKIRSSKVLVAGVGGLGSSASLYLTLAGVGRLTIVDDEVVELSNLNRQILYTEDDVDQPKAIRAAEKLRIMNPDVDVEPIVVRINRENVETLLNPVDLVVDGLDTFTARFIVNEACVKLGKPYIHAAAYMAEGRLTTIIPGKGPCLRCMIREKPREHELTPILGPTPGALGCLQALEAIKLITGVGEPLVGRLLIIDGLNMDFYILPVKRDPECPVCGKKELREDG